MNIHSLINERVCVFDGAMGTYYTSLYGGEAGACERANLSHPDRIRKIHEEYIRAGAKAIRTNTFNTWQSAGGEISPEQLVRAGWENAMAAAKEAGSVSVFADIGPAPGYDTEEILTHYQEIARLFLDCGAACFLFETLSDFCGIAETARLIRAEKPDAFIMVSFGIQPDGFSRDGMHYRSLLKKAEESGLIDAVGLNCVSGALHMAELVREAGERKLPFGVMPNAGYPIVRGNRTYFESEPYYFAEQINDMADLGASIFGGCCGTTPQYIRAVSGELGLKRKSKPIVYTGRSGQTKKRPDADGRPRTENRFFEKLEAGKKVIAVELDSPRNSEADKFMHGAAQIKAAGADALTIADCPIARARMDSSILACKVRRELGIDVLPHMTCRDRNINATKALLLGVHAEDIRNVLVITGDPVPSAERDEVRSVYQFQSVKLASYIQGLNEEVFDDPLRVFGALNLNAVNFDAELRKTIRKEEAGVCGFLTQPVLTERAFENLKQAREVLHGYILGGIIPIVSERNARFMEHEVSGINVSDRLIKLYEGKDREESEALAYEVSCQIASRIGGITDGFYLMTPFSRTELMSRIIRTISEY